MKRTYLFLILGFLISSCHTTVPEVGPPLTTERSELTKGQQAGLAEVEQKHGEGELTETEYQIEKDSVAREKIITF
ncbi:MAG: hypothetical protein HY585_03040 [Candidatus Omnitrophica bacterium]|nr:hypothetical protein [Candidatus Omnitrophota bacterium]